METLEQKIARVTKEHVAVAPYDRNWPAMFEQERDHLLACLPGDLVKRVEHFGSTAVPGLDAKPIVDILVEVADLEETRRRIAPLLEAQGYDYFWRPSSGDSTPPFYAWFIKRDESGARTHHIHMVEAHFEHWDRLLFRDYLIQHPQVAREYAELKLRLSERHDRDRVAYTEAKSDFIASVTERARKSRSGMPAVVIVSGCPGSGKTTLAKALARLRPQGLHLLSDVFYRFPAAPIEPTHPESQHQNTVIMRALGRSARAFAEGGYQVFLDGVIGPWFLPVLREELSGSWPVSYLLLHVPEPLALRRVRAREGPGASAQVRHMASAFADLPAFREHRIDAAGLSPEEVVEVAERGLSSDRFLLGW